MLHRKDDNVHALGSNSSMRTEMAYGGCTGNITLPPNASPVFYHYSGNLSRMRVEHISNIRHVLDKEAIGKLHSFLQV